ncbi:10291_t:CDS:2 [Ambispora gerdemannii]|uniref:10291_t:CDS:1 n=1 Tax=Ambispora gerdemannii TaxID=144530 RepID=A0A9N9EY33_9GLOM|nr:10291_t:CDS:2 [Ambispora gerdemannii]
MTGRRGNQQTPARRGAQQRQGLGDGPPSQIRGRGNRIWRGGGQTRGNTQVHNNHTGGSATSSIPKSISSTNPSWPRASGGNISLTRGGANNVRRPYNMTWRGNAGSRGRRERDILAQDEEMLAQDEEMQLYEDAEMKDSSANEHSQKTNGTKSGANMTRSKDVVHNKLFGEGDTGEVTNLGKSPDPNVPESDVVMEFLEKFHREYNHTCARCRAADFFYTDPLPLQLDRKIIFEKSAKNQADRPMEYLNNNNNQQTPQAMPHFFGHIEKSKETTITFGLIPPPNVAVLQDTPNDFHSKIPSTFFDDLPNSQTPKLPTPRSLFNFPPPLLPQISGTPQENLLVIPSPSGRPQEKPEKALSFELDEGKGKRCLPIDSESESKKKRCLSPESVDGNVKSKKKLSEDLDSKEEEKTRGKEKVATVASAKLTPSKKKEVKKIQIKLKKRSRPWQEIKVDHDWHNSNFKLRYLLFACYYQIFMFSISR